MLLLCRVIRNNSNSKNTLEISIVEMALLHVKHTEIDIFIFFDLSEGQI